MGFFKKLEKEAKRTYNRVKDDPLQAFALGVGGVSTQSALGLLGLGEEEEVGAPEGDIDTAPFYGRALEDQRRASMLRRQKQNKLRFSATNMLSSTAGL